MASQEASPSMDSSPGGDRNLSASQDNEVEIQVFLDLFEKLQIEVERFTVQMKRNRAHEEDLERELKKTKAELQRAGSEIRHLQTLNKVFHKESKQAASASTSSKRTRIIKHQSIEASETENSHRISKSFERADTSGDSESTQRDRSHDSTNIDVQALSTVARTAGTSRPPLSRRAQEKGARSPSPVPSRALSPISVRSLSEEQDEYEENYPPSAIGRSPEGPFDLVDLRKLLGLNDETMSNIASLGKETRPCFRVHFSDGLAFVCKAHTIESGKKSYLVDWGLPGANEPLKNVLERESKRGGLRIHTFLYPTSTRGWWYLGELEWKVVKLPQLWSVFDRRTRGRLEEVIARSCYCGKNGARMGRGIGEGVLEQFCVEVKSDRRLRERSVKFAASRLEGRLR